MATETEIKVRLNDLEGFRRRLASMECPLLSSRHFEDNYLLDFTDRRMAERRSLMRVRFAENRAWITYKGPPQVESIFKIREELETEVEDGSAALRILESLGLRVWFRYQKYRQEHALTVPGKREERIHLALDETPVGNYAEFEGSEDGIRNTAEALGFNESMFLRASYYALYMQYCSDRGESPGDMVFPDEQIMKNLPI